MDDRSLQTPTANVPDAGTPPPAPTPAMSSAIQPAPNAPQADSNAPDASTPAAKSMPPALVNNPQVPSQKLATQADLNKTSPAPEHSALYNKAVMMTGGPRTVASVDANGQITRTPVQPKPWALGLALALDVLSGGMKGGSEKNSTDAFQAGQAQEQQQRDAVKQANLENDATARADQNHKLAITEANMRLYQTGVTAAKTSLEASQAFGDNAKVVTDPLLDGTIQLPQGASMERKSMDDTMASVANGRTNITKDILFPVGDAQPSLDKTGNQIVIDGKPQTKHDYLIIHGVGPDGKIPLTKDMQDEFNKYGVKHIPEAGIGEPMWPFADIAKSLAQVSSLKNGEMILQMAHDSVHDLLPDHEEQDIDIAKAVKDKPEWNKAIDLLAQAQHSLPGANTHTEDVLNVVGQKSASAQGLLMNYLGLKAKDLDTLHNQRVKEAAEATAAGKAGAKAMTMEQAKDTLAKAEIDYTKPVDQNGMQGGRKLTDDQKEAFNLLSTDEKSKANLKMKELQDTRAVQNTDIDTAAKNIVNNPTDPVALRSISSLRGDERIRLFNAIKAQGGNVSALDRNAKLLDQFENGKQADQVQSFQTFLKHDADLYQAAGDFGRPGYTPSWVNKPLNYLEKNAAADPEIAAYLAKIQPVKDEIQTFLKNNHAPLATDVDDMNKILSSSLSPNQIQAVAKSLAGTAQFRLDSLNTRYKKAFNQDYDGLYDDESRNALSTLGFAQVGAGAGRAAFRPAAKALTPPNPADVVKSGKMNGQPVFQLKNGQTVNADGSPAGAR